jgi:hypothetical protein
MQLNGKLRSRPIVQSLETAVRALDVGATITFEELNRIAGIDLREPRNRYLIGLMRDTLLKAGTVLVSVRNVGYQIASPTNKLEENQSRRKRAMNAVKTGTQVLTSIDMSKIDDTTKNRVGVEMRKNLFLEESFKAVDNKTLDYEFHPTTEQQIVRFLVQKGDTQDVTSA